MEAVESAALFWRFRPAQRRLRDRVLTRRLCRGRLVCRGHLGRAVSKASHLRIAGWKPATRPATLPGFLSVDHVAHHRFIECKLDVKYLLGCDATGLFACKAVRTFESE